MGLLGARPVLISHGYPFLFFEVTGLPEDGWANHPQLLPGRPLQWPV
jgi:hypothetical protein